MTSRDDDRPGDDTTQSTGRRPGQRRARVAAGVVGAAAVLGGAAYLTTSTMMAKNSTTAANLPAPAVRSDLPSPSEPAAPSTSASASERPSSAPATVTASASSPVPEKVRKMIEKARQDGEKHGIKVTRPLPQPATTVAGIQQADSGRLGGTVRVVSAPGDLTGQRELTWVAGGVSKYKGYDCSQTFKFNTNPVPTRKPNLLMCWRTSAQKSVIAVVVDAKGHPSKDKALAAISQRWNSMG